MMGVKVDLNTRENQGTHGRHLGEPKDTKADGNECKLQGGFVTQWWVHVRDEKQQ